MKDITTIRVSRGFWQYVQDNQRLGESKEDTLKRLVKEAPRDE